MTDKPLQLGLAGLGTVGTGVYETLCRNHELLEARAQMQYAVKRVAVRDKGRVRGVELAPGMLTDDWRELVNDPDIGIDVVNNVMVGYFSRENGKFWRLFGKLHIDECIYNFDYNDNYKV